MQRRKPFDAPYGGAIQHVTDPARNHGYRHLVAFSVDIGSYAAYIIDKCAEAKRENAPEDALYKDSKSGEWVTYSSYPQDRKDDPWDSAYRIAAYVEALIKYEKENPR